MAHFLQYSLSFVMFTTSWLVMGYAFKKQFYVIYYLELSAAIPNLMSALVRKFVVNIFPMSENSYDLFAIAYILQHWINIHLIRKLARAMYMITEIKLHYILH